MTRSRREALIWMTAPDLSPTGILSLAHSWLSGHAVEGQLPEGAPIHSIYRFPVTW
jgi:hypothetical protein